MNVFGYTYHFAPIDLQRFTIDYIEDAQKGKVEQTLGPLLQHPRVQKFFQLDASRLQSYKQVCVVNGQTCVVTEDGTHGKG